MQIKQVMATSVLAALVSSILLWLAISCQSDSTVLPPPTDDGAVQSVGGTSVVSPTSTPSTVHSPPQASTQEAVPPVVYEKTVQSMAATINRSSMPSVSMLRIAPPANVQEFVNRSDAIVIGSVASVEGPFEELGYGFDLDYVEGKLEGPGFLFALPTTTVTYYAIDLEEILLDDGNILGNSSLRVNTSFPDSFGLQSGDRLLFSLLRNPDFRSYGAIIPWALIFLDGVEPRELDGNSLPYRGVTDEASLVAAIESAIPGRVSIPVDLWASPPGGEGQWDGAVSRRSIWDSRGGSLMTAYRPPLDAQDFVNRADAIVVGTISDIGDTFVLEQEDPDPIVLAILANLDVRAPGLAVTDYAIEVEEILLEYSGTSPVSSLRLLGMPSPRRPQVGERFLFSLRFDKELRSYGVCCDWNLVILDDVPLRYFDDGALIFDGVSDEASLIVAVESVLSTRVKTCPNEWATRPGFGSFGRNCE